VSREPVESQGNISVVTALNDESKETVRGTVFLDYRHQDTPARESLGLSDA
jgi:hypothetical protein